MDRVGTLGICSIPFFTTTKQEIFRSNSSDRSNALEMKLRHTLSVPLATTINAVYAARLHVYSSSAAFTVVSPCAGFGAFVIANGWRDLVFVSF